MILIFFGFPASATIVFDVSTTGSVCLAGGTRTTAADSIPVESFTLYRTIRALSEVLMVKDLSELTVTPSSSDSTFSS